MERLITLSQELGTKIVDCGNGLGIIEFNKEK